MAITLGKDVTITGVNGARSCTVDSQSSEIDVTAFGDSARKYRKQLIEQTCELECVDDPGVSIGATFALGGPNTSSATFIVTNVSQNEPIDDIVTYTVSGQRAS